MTEKLFTLEMLIAMLGKVTVTLGRPGPGLQLMVPPEFLQAACEARGHSLSPLLGQRESRYPHITFQPTEDVLEWLDMYGIYGRNTKIGLGCRSLENTYYFELIGTNNRIYMRYSTILGSRLLGTLDEANKLALLNRVADGLHAELVSV